jgi:cyclic pyranopterin phosphate synthase
MNARDRLSSTAVLPAPIFPVDRIGRRPRDLRISVIDRCNFRCIYCMPKTVFGRNYPFLQRAELLSFEEIARVATAAVDLGIEKIRITGGEPLLRRDLERLVEQLAHLPVEIALTTNGSLLKAKARLLKDAGLRRVTVSLDAFDEAVFRRMSDADYPVAAVLNGIEAAETAGLAPVKINCVVKRGVNDDQIPLLARHFRHSGHVLRFIEYMDAGAAHGWRMDDVVPSREVLARIHTEFPLEPVEPEYLGEVAERWRYVDGGGEIGVIAAVTQAFCAGCTRLRLSTDGKLYTCLFASAGHDLRIPLRNGASHAELTAAIAGIWYEREDRYSEMRTAATAHAERIEMSYIGG